jgi:hypothetical protein
MSFNCLNMIVLLFRISTSFASFEIWKWYSLAVYQLTTLCAMQRQCSDTLCTIDTYSLTSTDNAILCSGEKWELCVGKGCKKCLSTCYSSMKFIEPPAYSVLLQFWVSQHSYPFPSSVTPAADRAGFHTLSIPLSPGPCACSDVSYNWQNRYVIFSAGEGVTQI